MSSMLEDSGAGVLKCWFEVRKGEGGRESVTLRFLFTPALVLVVVRFRRLCVESGGFGLGVGFELGMGFEDVVFMRAGSTGR